MVGRRPVRVVTERPVRRSLARPLDPGRLVLAERRIGRPHERRDRESRPDGVACKRREARPDGVVERSLHVAGDDRVPFSRRGAHRRSKYSTPIRSTGALVVVLVAALPRLARPRCASARRSSRSSWTRATASRRRSSTSGTFGFLAGVPSAYTQPLYGWFLAAIYLAVRPVVARGRDRPDRRRRRDRAARLRDRHAPALDRRRRSSRRSLATLHPYLVWHDVHLNREILDGLAARAARAARALAAYERRSLPLVGGRGARRRPCDPRQRAARPAPRSCLAVYVAWRSPLGHALHGRRARGRLAAVRRRALGRAEQGPGRLLRDHDGLAGAVEGEQPEHATTCSTRQAGSTTCPSSPARRPGPSWPQT